HGYRYMYYAPLGVNDWNVITVISADVLEKKMNQVMYKTYSLSASLLAIFIMTLGYILITQRKNRQIIMDIAYVDPLTGGYSYAKFQKEFPAVLADVTRKAAILNLDIDDFKFINDAFGYREGDNLIRYIWNILSTWVEKDELYAHQSADVFVALVFYDEEEKLRERLDDLCEQLQHYYIRHNNKVRIVPAIGIHEIMNKTQSQDSFIDAARLARKTVKGKMDIFYAFYDEAIKESIYHDKEIEATMQDALNNHEFIVYYQPKYNADTQQIEGAEALVRWQKKDGTLVPPNDFIPLFERNGFITAVDSYVFKSVCRFQRSLMDQGITPVPISVNLSRMHIYDLDFIEKYTTYMEQLQIPISYIQLEITESAISDNQALLLDVLNRLHQLGFLILLDDFGTGYSSMLMLKNLSIDVLKIDKSFVDNIGDHRGNKIIDGIISLSQSLDISITAEGVEQQSQYEYLKMRGCNHIQGYYFAKPMAEAAFKKLL
ncbi:MAG: GGDEF domain-containing phosphodiesterase, partial [Lachnospiraceae bacterium]